MEENDEQSQIQQLQRFTESVASFFAPRIVGAVAIHQKGNEQPAFELASGCLTVIEEMLVWLTAGHFIADVHNWRSEQSLQELFIVFVVNESAIGYLPLDLDANAAFNYSDTKLLDAGFIVFEREIAGALIESSVKALSPTSFGSQGANDLIYQQLIGFSSDGSVLGKTLVDEFTAANKKWPVYKVELRALEKRHVFFQPPQTSADNPLQLIFKPLRTREEKTVAGMSGGPIVAFEKGRPVREFRLLGFQSGERHTERAEGTFMESVWCSDALAVLHSIQAQLTQ